MVKHKKKIELQQLSPEVKESFNEGKCFSITNRENICLSRITQPITTQHELVAEKDIEYEEGSIICNN